MSKWLLRHNTRSLRRARPCPPRRWLSISHAGRRRHTDAHDPRARDVEKQLYDEYATLREDYLTPKHPIVLAHGLFGFSELRLASFLPAVQYWHGIKDALTARGATVVAASVPPSSSIEDRAAKLRDDIAAQLLSGGPAPPSIGQDVGPAAQDPVCVNIIAHSMGGLDARYMISRLLPPNLRVASLVTVATPHRGSPFADYVLAAGAGPLYLPRLYGVLKAAGFGTAAFTQLTTPYMADSFNRTVVDDPAVRYFSYGAQVDKLPLLSPFRLPHSIVAGSEGANDGLVSVQSSRWGAYQGTLLATSHLDLINWPNRLRWTARGMMGMKKPFNAVAFYLDIADMLAQQGL